jgi:hypothetical protein
MANRAVTRPGCQRPSGAHLLEVRHHLRQLLLPLRQLAPAREVHLEVRHDGVDDDELEGVLHHLGCQAHQQVCRGQAAGAETGDDECTAAGLPGRRRDAACMWWVPAGSRKLMAGAGAAERAGRGRAADSTPTLHVLVGVGPGHGDLQQDESRSEAASINSSKAPRASGSGEMRAAAGKSKAASPPARPPRPALLPAAHVVQHGVGVQAKALGNGPDALRPEGALGVDECHLQAAAWGERCEGSVGRRRL